MVNSAEKVALVTGANTGIGKELARQLGASGRYRKVYLACRNQAKANAAKLDLEKTTQGTRFEVIQLDVSSLASVRKALEALERIDDLFMNAGGAGGKTPLKLTVDGVTEIFAANTLGHIALLEGLIEAKKLKNAALLVGSEAARGVPKLGIKRPVFNTSSADEYASVCDGSFFRDRKFESPLAYAQVKYMGALCMSAIARHHPELRLVTLSPGNTSGTDGARDQPLPLRLLLTYVLMPVVLPLFGLVHGVDKGAKRLLDGLDDGAIKSGSFYASAADSLTGPVVDQSRIWADFSSTSRQDNAYEATHRFMRP